MAMNSRHSLPLLALLLLLVAVLYSVWSPAPPALGSPSEPAVMAAPPAVPMPPAAPESPAEQLARVEQLMEKPKVLEEYMRRYQEANRYSPGTVPLVPGMTDALEPFHMPAQDTPVMAVRNIHTRPEQRLYTRFESDKFIYVAPEPVRLQFTLFRGEQARTPVPVRVTPVSVRRLHADGRQTELGSLELQEQVPGVYAATYVPHKRRGAEDEDVLQFEVGWELAEGSYKPGRERVLIQYTSLPPASFTGRFHERVEQGSLRIDVEVESQREGQAQVAANLFAADGVTPVAMAVANAPLQPGRGWVTLEFYGLVFHDRGVAGPYVLKTLRGHFPSATTAGRGPEFIPWSHEYRTQPLPLSAFTRREWDSPQKQAGLRAYQQELERLRAERRP